MLAENRIVDVIFVNDEIDLLRYRLSVHAPVTLATIIIESRMTFQGAAKPLHAREALSVAEVLRHKVRFVEIGPRSKMLGRLQHALANASFGNQLRLYQHTWSTPREHAAFDMEQSQRRDAMPILQREIQAQLQACGHDFLVYVSDVDELLDPRLLMRTTRPLIDHCQSPSLRHYHYGIHCAEYKPAYARPVVFRALSPWLNFTSRHRIGKFRWDPLRNMDAGRGKVGHCPHTRSFVGWHLSYFLTSEQILHKLRSFSHHNDPHIARALTSNEPLRYIAESARRCRTIRGKALAVEILPYSGADAGASRQATREQKGIPISPIAPPVSGRPHHPAAPVLSHFASKVVERKLRQCDEVLQGAGHVPSLSGDRPRSGGNGTATHSALFGESDQRINSSDMSWYSWSSAWRVIHPSRPPVVDKRLPPNRLKLLSAAAQQAELREGCMALRQFFL